MIWSKYRALKNVLRLSVFVVFIFGCKMPEYAIKDKEWLFYHDFEITNHSWQTVYTLLDEPNNNKQTIGCWKSWQSKFACTSFITISNGEAILQSPWWLDSNHAQPGAGYLNLLFYNYVDTIFSGRRKSINLDNRTLHIELRSKKLNLKNSKLLFWFQTKASDGKYINFVFTKEQISLDENMKIIELKFTSKPSDWTCLGSNANNSGIYSCIPLKDAISDVNIDFGLIIFPTSADSDPSLQPEGQIFIKSIGIY